VRSKARSQVSMSGTDFVRYNPEYLDRSGQGLGMRLVAEAAGFQLGLPTEACLVASEFTLVTYMQPFVLPVV
jgi:hypothetical protein